MDEGKYKKYAEDIDRGDERGSGRFQKIVQNLAADPKIGKMSEEAQDRIMDKIANRYKQKAKEEEAKKKAKEPKSMLGGGGEGNDAPSRDSGGPQSPAGKYGSEEFSKGLMQGLGNWGLTSGLTAVGTSLAMGAPLGTVAKGMLSPGVIGPAALGIVSDAAWGALGYDTPKSFLESLPETVLGAAISFANPVAGLVFSTVGKPVVEGVMDYMDVRKHEVVRDELEDTLGKIRGMQLNKEMLSKVTEDPRTKDIKNIQDLLNIKTELVNIDLATANEKTIAKSKEDLKSLERLAGVAEYERQTIHDPDLSKGTKEAIEKAKAAGTTIEAMEKGWASAKAAEAKRQAEIQAEAQRRATEAATKAASTAEREKSAAQNRAAEIQAAENLKKSMPKSMLTGSVNEKNLTDAQIIARETTIQPGTKTIRADKKKSVFSRGGEEGGSDHNVGGERGSSTGTGGGYNDGKGGVTGL